MRESFFNALYGVMRKRADVFILISDTGAIVLDRIRRDFKGRCVNVGIAESNMVSVAAGMAMAGKTVYIYAIVPFVTRRCYEQLLIDVCCQGLDVKVIGIGAGLDYSTLGPTHHGQDDLALMRNMPGMSVLTASDKTSAAAFARASLERKGPVYIRLERYGGSIYGRGAKFDGAPRLLRDGADICLLACGKMVSTALEAAAELEKHSISARVVDCYCLKPLAAAELERAVGSAGHIATLEEHSVIGGLGSAVAEFLAERGKGVRFMRFGMADAFCRVYGKREFLHRQMGIDRESVVSRVIAWMKEE